MLVKPLRNWVKNIKKDKTTIEVRIKLPEPKPFTELHKKGILTYFYNSAGLDFSTWQGKNFTKETIKAELTRLETAGFQIYWNKLSEIVAYLVQKSIYTSMYQKI